jgi:hypothetical protein
LITLSHVSICPLPIASSDSVNRLNSIFGLSYVFCCMFFDALSLSVLTRIITFDQKCVKCIASSMATSPHPITTNTFSLNIGNAPSQTAHADIHLCRYSFSPGIHKRFAIAPVAMITDFASIISFPLKSFSGCQLKSTLSMVLVSILVPACIVCSLILAISPIHPIPWGNHGKFSIIVVVVSCPPAATPPAINPSNMSGLRFALAA